MLKHDTLMGEFEKLVELDFHDSYQYDYKQQEKHIKELTKYIKGEREFQQVYNPNENFTCKDIGKRGTDDPDAQWSWAPVFTGVVSPTKKI